MPRHIGPRSSRIEAVESFVTTTITHKDARGAPGAKFVLHVGSQARKHSTSKRTEISKSRSCLKQKSKRNLARKPLRGNPINNVDSRTESFNPIASRDM